MIISIDSSLSTFKRLELHEGLNVLLSDSHADASEGLTRNSAGKTSMVEIIHFLTGADCKPDSLFRCDALVEHFFEVTFRIEDSEVCVKRTGAKPARIYITRGLEDRMDLPIKVEKGSELRFISNTDWKLYLGHTFFGLPQEPAGTIYDQSYTPSFRSMFSYFARRYNSGGFVSPERHAEKQARWDWQENISYLLGLDWKISFEFQKVRAREKTLEELRKAADAGALGDVVGTVAELRPKVTVADRKAAQRREQLANFQVLESYNDLATEAARAKTQMQALSRETVSLRENLGHLESALQTEAPPDRSALEAMYAAAGVELPDVALKRLKEVQSFYESVVNNRAIHLSREIADLTQQISANEQALAALDRERQRVLQILQTRGALEDFLALQQELAELEAEAATLRERFKAAEILEGESTELDIDRSNLHRRLQQDFQERRERLDQAILLVANAIGTLYDDRDGGFEISATDKGPFFEISIEGDRGGGIASMEIFCFDLALFDIVSSEGHGPGFLVHDSHLFDGVDERQIARALRLGRDATEGKGLQYIVTMNSDIFHRLPLDDHIDPEEVVLPTRLSDHSEDGGLFGFRFD